MTKRFVEHVKIEPSTKWISLCLIGGLAAVLFGISLELYVYKRFSFELRDSTLVINGWWFVAFGGLSLLIGIQDLIFYRSIIELDSTGVHSEKQSLSIPWEEIRSARIGMPEYAGSPIIALSVHSLEKIPNAKYNRRIRWMLWGSLSEDEIPISLVGGDCDPVAILASINSVLADDANN